MSVRLLITGSRDFEDERYIGSILKPLQDRYSPTLVVGDCPTGVDLVSKILWETTKVEIFYADWDDCYENCPEGHRKTKPPNDIVHRGIESTYCPFAGPRRNKRMVDTLVPKRDLCIGFPRGASWGTRNCMKLAKQKGITVIER